MDERNKNKTPTEMLIKKLNKSTKVLFGTLAGVVATALVHPLDCVKVRMQVREKKISTNQVFRLIVKCEGGRALYTGLSAALFRQVTYTTSRLATYHMLNEHFKRKKNIPNEVSLISRDKVMIGVYAGLVGAFVGNPSEVALVRMMVDGPRLCSVCRSPPRRYRGVFHAFYRISRDEGIAALWRGGTLTLARSVAVSMAQIGVYAEVNELLRNEKILEGLPAHIITSLASSFVTAFLSLPVDTIKTRYQVRRDSMTQREIFHDLVRRNGTKYLWKGITPYFARLAIHTIVTLIIVESLTEALFKFKEKEKTKG